MVGKLAITKYKLKSMESWTNEQMFQTEIYDKSRGGKHSSLFFPTLPESRINNDTFAIENMYYTDK